MKKFAIIILCLAFSSGVLAEEIPNGQWSVPSQIIEITSYWTVTTYKLNTSYGCGSAGDGLWVLATESSNSTQDRALDYKKSILLAAYMAGKTVQLRCENSTTSDLKVIN